MMNFLQNAAKALTSDDVDYQYGDLKLGLQEHTLRSFVNYFEYFGSPDQRISRSDLETYLLDKGFPSDEQSVGAHIDRIVPVLDAYNGQFEVGKLTMLYREQLNYV